MPSSFQALPLVEELRFGRKTCLLAGQFKVINVVNYLKILPAHLVMLRQYWIPLDRRHLNHFEAAHGLYNQYNEKVGFHEDNPYNLQILVSIECQTQCSKQIYYNQKSNTVGSSLRSQLFPHSASIRPNSLEYHEHHCNTSRSSLYPLKLQK